MPGVLNLLLDAVTGGVVVLSGGHGEVWLRQAPPIHLAIGEGGQLLDTRSIPLDALVSRISMMSVLCCLAPLKGCVVITTPVQPW